MRVRSVSPNMSNDSTEPKLSLRLLTLRGACGFGMEPYFSVEINDQESFQTIADVCVSKLNLVKRLSGSTLTYTYAMLFMSTLNDVCS